MDVNKCYRLIAKFNCTTDALVLRSCGAVMCYLAPQGNNCEIVYPVLMIDDLVKNLIDQQEVDIYSVSIGCFSILWM